MVCKISKSSYKLLSRWVNKYQDKCKTKNKKGI